MSAVNIPTVEEIHQIAYLTMQGWKYNAYSEKWSHKDYSRKVQKKRPCGCCEDTVFDDQFDLEDAYAEQLESEEP